MRLAVAAVESTAAPTGAVAAAGRPASRAFSCGEQAARQSQEL